MVMMMVAVAVVVAVVGVSGGQPRHAHVTSAMGAQTGVTQLWRGGLHAAKAATPFVTTRWLTRHFHVTFAAAPLVDVAQQPARCYDWWGSLGSARAATPQPRHAPLGPLADVTRAWRGWPPW